MFWKAARVAVVLSVCALITSAVANEPLRSTGRPITPVFQPAVGSPQPDQTPSRGSNASPSPASTHGPRPTSTPGVVSTSTPTGVASPPPRVAPLPLPITNVADYGAVGNGHSDSTAAVARATSIAESRGGTLYFPAGHYLLHGSGIGSAIEIREGHPLTIAGPASALVTLTNTNVSGGLLSIRVDHTVVEDLTLDAQSSNTRQALGAVANDVTVENCRILGGRQFFAIYFAGPAGASPSAPAYNTGNRLLNDAVSDLVSNDGISWSFQENSLIENLQHTGSRLALYVDRYVTVQNETYRPGPQGGGTAGFWISSPSDHITINNFTSYGMGGIISNNGADVSSDITIANERLMVPGNTLRVDAVNGLTIRGCNFGSDGTLMFTGSMAATSVVVEDCAALPMVRFQGSSIVRAAFIANAYLGVPVGTALHRQTFYNYNSAHPSFTVNGGVWMNRPGGFFGGAPATYTVSNLAGYP
jgi:Pectate lyase superfamily protein